MRLIDADALEKKLQEQREIYINLDMLGAEHLLVHDFLRYVWEAPTIGAVQVVRCKDCRHVEREDEPLIGMWCTRLGSNDMAVWDNCFCSFGERREEGEA